MAVPFDTGIFSLIGLNSELLIGAKLYWYASGTSTPLATYSDNGLTTPNANPVPSDASGRFPPIYLQSAEYKFILKTAADVTLVTRDPVDGESPLDLLSAASGSGLVGFQQSGAGALLSNVQDQLRAFIRISQFTGADPTGATDSTTAINAAIAQVVAAGGGDLLVDGKYKHLSKITVPSNVNLLGYGTLVSEPTQRSPSCFIKGFSGLGFLFSGDDCGVDGVQFDAATGMGGVGVQVTGTRFRAPFICVSNHGGDNLWIGATEAGAAAINANDWEIGYLKSYKSGGSGFVVKNTNTSTGSTFPSGEPNVNAGSLISGDISQNAGNGITLGNSIEIRIGGGRVNSHDNTGHGVYLTDYACGHVLDVYTEANADDLYCEATTSRNICRVGFSPKTGIVYTDLGKNIVRYFASYIGKSASPSDPRSGSVSYGNELCLVDGAASGASVELGGYLGPNAAAARWKLNQVGSTNQTRASLVTYDVSTGEGERFKLDSSFGAFIGTSFIGFGKQVDDMTTAGWTIFANGGSLGRANAVLGGSNGTILSINTSAGNAGAISASGTTTTYATSSDENLKENFRDVDSGALIDAVWMGEFDWKAGGVGYGCRAQQAVEHIPEAIVRGSEDSHWMADYSKFVPILWAEVQKLRNRVAELEK